MSRLFIGIYPGGIVYADKQREKHGDYARAAFLPYHSLELQLEPDCPDGIKTRITEHAATIIRRKGERFEISACGQTVTLGRLMR